MNPDIVFFGANGCTAGLIMDHVREMEVPLNMAEKYRPAYALPARCHGPDFMLTFPAGPRTDDLG